MTATPLAVISRAEFQRRRDALVRFGRGAVMVFIVGVLALAPAFLYIDRVLLPGWSASARGLFLLVLPLAGFVLALLVGWANTLRRRALGLTCPQCGTPLVQIRYDRGIDTAVVLSGGRCTKCKRPLVEDRVTAGIPIAPSFLPSGTPPANPAAFVALRDRFDRDTRRESAFLTCVGIGAVMAAWLGTRTLFAQAGLFIVAGIWLLPPVVIFAVIIRLERRWELRARALGLACAKCGTLFVGGRDGAVSRAVLELGACPHCETPLWT